MEGEGLAAQSVANVYGDGKGNTVTHYYAGKSKSKKKKDK